MSCWQYIVQSLPLWRPFTNLLFSIFSFFFYICKSDSESAAAGWMYQSLSYTLNLKGLVSVKGVCCYNEYIPYACQIKTVCHLLDTQYNTPAFLTLARHLLANKKHDISFAFFGGLRVHYIGWRSCLNKKSPSFKPVLSSRAGELSLHIASLYKPAPNTATLHWPPEDFKWITQRGGMQHLPADAQ